MRRTDGYQQGIKLPSPQKRIAVFGPILLSGGTASLEQLFQAILVRGVSKAGILGSAEICWLFYMPCSWLERVKRRVGVT
jgi:hypothetical protein